MEDDAKFLIGAYQKKSFDLFNQVIATEARVQQFSEIIEAQKAKIDEFSAANKGLAEEIQRLENHIRETHEQTNSALPTKPVTRKRKSPPKSAVIVQDAGQF